VYNNKFLTNNRIDLFVCAYIMIWLCMACIQVIGILFMNFCLCAYLYISLCIEVILSLCMNLCFSCILSWIICIEFVMTLNIHQVLVSLEEWLIYVILLDLIFFPPPQIIVLIYLFVHILEKWRYRWKKRICIWHMISLFIHLYIIRVREQDLFIVFLFSFLFFTVFPFFFYDKH